MIDFRYHLVSIISVFLALAIGVVIGTTALNGAVVGDLRHQVRDLRGDKSTLQKQARSLQGQVAHGNDFAAAIGPAAVAGELTGQRVLVVAAPGASASDTAAVRNLITDAGGTVTTQLALSAAYTDPNHATDLQQYAASGIAPAGFTLPKSDDAGTVAGALLADVLMAPADAKAKRPTDAERQAVLSGFISQALMSLKPETPATAGVAVVVA
ncbi:MAG: copper transporter, partial [Mycobacteriales bacterium]